MILLSCEARLFRPSRNIIIPCTQEPRAHEDGHAATASPAFASTSARTARSWRCYHWRRRAPRRGAGLPGEWARQTVRQRQCTVADRVGTGPSPTAASPRGVVAACSSASCRLLSRSFTRRNIITPCIRSRPVGNWQVDEPRTTRTRAKPWPVRVRKRWEIANEP